MAGVAPESTSAVVGLRSGHSTYLLAYLPLLLSGVLTNPSGYLQVQQTLLSPEMNVAAAAYKEVEKPAEASLRIWADTQASDRHPDV